MRPPPLALLPALRAPRGLAGSSRLPAMRTTAGGLDRALCRLPAFDHRLVPLGLPLRGAGAVGAHAPQILGLFAGGPGRRPVDGGSPCPCAPGLPSHRAGRTIRPDLGAARSAPQARARVRPGRSAGPRGRSADGMARAAAPSPGRGDGTSGPQGRTRTTPRSAGSLRCRRTGRGCSGRDRRRRTNEWSDDGRMRGGSAAGRCGRSRRAHGGEISGRGRPGPLL